MSIPFFKKFIGNFFQIARARSPHLAVRWASLCRVLPSPFQRLTSSHRLFHRLPKVGFLVSGDWFTFIYRTTGLHAVGVIGSVAPAAVSRSHWLSWATPSTSRCLGLCHTFPRPLCLYYSTVAGGCQGVFHIFLVVCGRPHAGFEPAPHQACLGCPFSPLDAYSIAHWGQNVNSFFEKISVSIG